MNYYQKYLKYKNKYLYLKNMTGRGLDEIENKGVILINGSDKKISNEIEQIKEFIKNKIQTFFIDQYTDVPLPSLDVLFKYIDRCINFLLFKYTDKDNDDILKEKYKLNDDEIIMLRKGKFNISDIDTDKDVELIYNNKTGLSGKWDNFEGLWFFVNEFSNNNAFEKLCDGKTWLVIDKYFAQFMFFTIDGIMKFSIFPDLTQINFNFANDKTKPELSNNADIYIRFDKTSFTVPYKENFQQLLENEFYYDKNSMQSVIDYMYTYYIKKNTRFIALLGKARFWVSDTCEHRDKSKKAIQKIVKRQSSEANAMQHIFYESISKTAVHKAYEYTKEIISSLLFRNCNIGIVTGGYSGIMASECGITRTGYEIAKHYEKPIVTIMCNAGRFDKNKHSDAIGYFGMHWGDDTKALSSFVDGAIMIAPFGAWSQVELFMLSYKQKPCAIYLDKKYIDAIIKLINENKSDLTLSDITPLQNIFLKQKIKDRILGDLIVKDFGLGGADQFGLDILFKGLVYNKGTNTIEPNTFMQNIVGRIHENNKPFTLFYPHYITDENQNEANGIPIFNDYRSLTKYMTEKIKENNVQDKITEFDKIKLVEHDRKNILSLDRNWERPFNYLTGSYSEENIELESHTEE